MVIAAAWVGHKIIHSTALCHLVAFVVCASAFVAITVGWDRRPPFDYLPAFASPSTLAPGQASTIRFRMSEVRKACPGQFERWFIDAEGTPFSQGTFPTIYDKFVDMTAAKRYFDKDWAAPLNAAPGPGFYESRPRFWCNPMQWFYPIAAPIVRVPVTILPKQGVFHADPGEVRVSP